MTLDVLIRGGRLIDGTGVPWRHADIGISGDQVVAIGRLGGKRATREISAEGRIVCPGFIDIHSHADVSLLADQWVNLRLAQGITTEVVGQDGLSYAPASPERLREWRRYLRALNGDFPNVAWDWRSVADLLERYERRAANVVFLVPHGAVRTEAMGWADRPATVDELRTMQGIVRRSLTEGASGLSTGLTYVPCSHATTEEIVALCRPVAEAGGILAIHLRSYIGGLRLAIDEAIEIGRQSGVAVEINHLRMADPRTWGQAQSALRQIERARADGIDVTFDLYPYTIGCLPLFAMLPLWAQSGGPDAIMARLAEDSIRRRIADELASAGIDWPVFRICHAPGANASAGSIAAGAERAGMGVSEFVIRLLQETELGAIVMADGGNEAENALMLAHPASMVCSDGILLGDHPHPRGYGAFPRVLAQYVREKGLLSWETAIAKMTAVPAARLNLGDRGVVREGGAADVVIFSPEDVRDRATVEAGREGPTGIDTVLVNGHVVVERGIYVGSNFGRALRPLVYHQRGRNGIQG
jgi:N-acyl-D-amino-acid deacylase